MRRNKRGKEGEVACFGLADALADVEDSGLT
jgi:hypothetical protein